MLELSDSDLDDIFRALANPSRRAMLVQLTTGPASLSDLASPLDMTLSAVEQHLKVLEQCDLARSQKQGRVRTCRIEPETLRRVESWLGARRIEWERHLDRLGDFLEGTANHPQEKP